MTEYVLDASVALGFLLYDERSQYAVSVARRLGVDSPVVPEHWETEVVNGILTAVRRGRLSLPEAVGIASTLRTAMKRRRVDLVPDPAQLLDFAASSGLTAYDAAYLQIVLRLGLPLATLDRRMLACAQALNVVLYEPAST